MSEDLLDFKRDQPLSAFSTFRIGGPARWWVTVSSIPKMQEILRHCTEKHIRYMVLGKGSNVLFDDRGFNGLVIHAKIDFCEDLTDGRYRVGAGHSFSRLGAFTARRGYAGLEFASGIPGSVGGAVFMNAGANGIETCEHLESVEFVDPSGSLKTFKREELDFSYRSSSFQHWGGAIVAATFALKPDPEARQRQIEIVRYRQATQPYGDKSAGCIFRNPQGSSAGSLIDASGLKGTRIGGAEVSPRHANFVVNCEGATSEDVRNLVDEVRRQVRDKMDVLLESEVRYIPYDVEHENE